MHACGCVCVHVCATAPVEVRGQLWYVNSLFLLQVPRIELRPSNLHAKCFYVWNLLALVFWAPSLAQAVEMMIS